MIPEVPEATVWWPARVGWWTNLKIIFGKSKFDWKDTIPEFSRQGGSSEEETVAGTTRMDQDNILNASRKESRVTTIFLRNGTVLTGKVRAHDIYTIILETGRNQILIYKHAVTGVVMGYLKRRSD